MEAGPFPLSSRPSAAKWRDLRFLQSFTGLNGSGALPFVIPTERSEVEGSAVSSIIHQAEWKRGPYPCHPDRSASEAEGSAVSSIIHQAEWKRGPYPCHPDRSASEVEGSAVSSIIHRAEWKSGPSLCHPDRSAAKWGDLEFLQSFTGLNGSAALPFVIPTERSEVEGSAVSSIIHRAEWKSGPSLCHPDRAQRSGGICGSFNHSPG